jgi:hypothetical protein
VKVDGKGSFLNSDNLKEFARGMLDHGYREFVVDLGDFATMDSTFMGTMARIVISSSVIISCSPFFLIVSLSPANRLSLGAAGVDELD